MTTITINTLKGTEFETFFSLLKHDPKGTQYEEAWRKVKQDIKHHSVTPNIVDLNVIFVDNMTLQMLVYPILDDTLQPLSDEEWNVTFEQFKSIVTQLKSAEKGLLKLKKMDPDLAEKVAPLAEKLRLITQEMRTYWYSYKEASEQFKPLDNEENREEVKLEEFQEKAEEPPIFNRIGWIVLKLSFESLLTEYKYLIKMKKEVTSKEEIVGYPLLQILVDEIQAIEKKTEGFELLEKVKIAKKRNEQLAEKLQQLYDDGSILHKESKLSNQDKESHSEESGASHSHEKKIEFNLDELKKHKKLLIWISGITIVLIGIALVLQQFSSTSQNNAFTSTKIGGAPVKGSSSNSKPRSSSSQPMTSQSGTLKGSSSRSSSSPSSIVATQNGFITPDKVKQLQQHQTTGTSIPIHTVNETLQPLTQPSSVSQSVLQNIMEEIGEVLILVVDQGKAYLASAENVIQFDSLSELETFLAKAKEQYQEFFKVIAVLQRDLTQYKISIEISGDPNTLGYSLVIRNHRNKVMGHIQLGKNGFELQWHNTSGSVVVPSPQDLVNTISDLESAQ